MAQFKVNPTRLDPYKNFKFRLKWDGNIVAAFSQVSPLTPATTHKSPGRTKYEAITLERGVTHDIDFQSWAGTTSTPGKPTPPSLATLRHDLTLEVLNETGQVTNTYTIQNSWVSEYQALPDLDAGANAIAIQHIKLENEGWTDNA